MTPSVLSNICIFSMEGFQMVPMLGPFPDGMRCSCRTAITHYIFNKLTFKQQLTFKRRYSFSVSLPHLMFLKVKVAIKTEEIRDMWYILLIFQE